MQKQQTVKSAFNKQVTIEQSVRWERSRRSWAAAGLGLQCALIVSSATIFRGSALRFAYGVEKGGGSLHGVIHLFPLISAAAPLFYLGLLQFSGADLIPLYSESICTHNQAIPHRRSERSVCVCCHVKSWFTTESLKIGNICFSYRCKAVQTFQPQVFLWERLKWWNSHTKQSKPWFTNS